LFKNDQNNTLNMIRDSGVKGVTPVVATVLLIGITFLVGGILVTQVEGLLDPGNTGPNLDVSMNVQSIYEDSGGNMTVSIANTGSTAINQSGFTAYVGGPPITGDGLCFTNGSKVRGTQESWECDTGEEYPGRLETKAFRISSNQGNQEWGPYECTPDSESDTTCYP
jgi:flagellin-like protein